MRESRTVGSAMRLAAIVGLLALVVGPLAQAAGMGWVSSSHQSGATACSGHGNTNFDRCFCDPGWTGPQCAKQEVEPNCGAHGKAWYGKCRCEAGWKGALCDTALLVCKNGAAEHGKCICAAGWSGATCDERQ